MTEKEPNAPQTEVGRRGFLGTGALVASGLVFGDWSRAEAANIPTRKLGRTGFDVTILSFGAIQLNNSAHVRVLDHAIDSGINLVHVSPGYQGGEALKVVGEVMKRKRDKVVLALKHGPDMGAVNQALRTLNTDHVDILIPDIGMDGTRQQDTGIRDRFYAVRDAKKCRFIGFPSHQNQAGCLRGAIASGWWDTCLLAYNSQNSKELDPVVAECVKQRKMGFMVMKAAGTFGRRGSSPAEFAANLRAILSNRNLATITLGQNSVQQVDANIAAVLQRITLADHQRQQHTVAACAGKLCSFCGACAQACPRNVAVMDYLRVGLYRDRGETRTARDLLESIPPPRSMAMCNNCGLCNGACDRRICVLDEIRSASEL